LLRKNQIDTKYDNKGIKILKEELWTRRVNIVAEVMVFRGNQVVKETILMDRI